MLNKKLMRSSLMIGPILSALLAAFPASADTHVYRQYSNALGPVQPSDVQEYESNGAMNQLHTDSVVVAATNAEIGGSVSATNTTSGDHKTRPSANGQVTAHAFAGVGAMYGAAGVATVDATAALGGGADGLAKQARIRANAGALVIGGIGAEVSHLSTGRNYSENVARVGLTPSIMAPLGDSSYLLILPQVLGGSVTQISDSRGSREIKLKSSGGEIALKSPKLSLNARAFHDWGPQGSRTELGLNGKYVLGNLVGQKTYVGADFTSISTRDAKGGDVILLEPSIDTHVRQATATAGFAF